MQAACLTMMTMALLLSLHSPWPALSPAWLRPPVLRVVPAQERWLQMENGVPAQAKRRSRVDLLEAALSQ